MKKQYLGHDHAEVADTLNNIGCCYGKRGDFEGALDLFNQALDIYSRTYDGQHPDVVNTQRNIESVHEQKINSFR